MVQNNFFIYSHFDFTNKSAGATRMLYYARILADESNKVYLTSCCKGEISDDNFDEIETNIYVLKRKKLTTNTFHILTFLIKLNSFSELKNGRKIFIFYPYPLVSLEVLSLLYLKAIKKHPIFYELNEIRKYTSTFHAPISFKKIVYSFKKIIYITVFTLIEPLLYFYNGLICISTSIEKYGSYYNKNTIRIPILTNPEIKVELTDNIYFKKDSFNIGFSGSVHPSKENLLDFIKIISLLNKNGFSVSFNLCGPITKEHEEILFNKNYHSNYFGNLNERELSTFLTQQDILVIPRGFSLQNKYGFSTKLSDYLNHKKIILLTNISDNQLFIIDGVNGFIVPPNDNRKMYDKLVYIIQNFDEIEDIIIQKSYETSKNEFYYLLFISKLRNFLLNNKSETPQTINE